MTFDRFLVVVWCFYWFRNQTGTFLGMGKGKSHPMVACLFLMLKLAVPQRLFKK